MADPVAPGDLETVVRLERELQSPACRADQARLAQLLAPDFAEVGASGRRWGYADTLAMLREEQAEPGVGDIEMHDVRTRALAPDVVAVTWDSARAGRRARRTSIWCRRAAGWQQVHHQGTLLPATVSAAPPGSGSSRSASPGEQEQSRRPDARCSRRGSSTSADTW